MSIASHWRPAACWARHVSPRPVCKQPVRLRDSIGGTLCFEDTLDLIYEELAGPHHASVRLACNTDAGWRDRALTPVPHGDMLSATDGGSGRDRSAPTTCSRRLRLAAP